MGYLSEATISYYRSYKKPQTTHFAIPNGQLGSGLTVVVGPNNAGKTTFLEAITLGSDKRISDNERVGRREPKIEFTLDDGSLKTLTTAQANSAQLIGDGINFETVPSRRFWPSRDSSSGSASAILKQSRSYSMRQGQDSRTISVAAILKDIEKIAEDREKFTSELRKIFPNFANWFVGYDGDSDYIGYKTSSGIKHRTDFLGDGVASVFRVLAHLQKGLNLLAIDEPELSLQPDAQKRLLAILAEYAKNRQILFSTHSPYFIDLSHFKNGAKYIRINKPNDKESIVKELKIFSNYASFFRGANWEMPFLFDEVAKEIFFQDDILLLEGPHDVGLIRKYFSSKGETPPFNFFGYGVRGYTNFEYALSFARDLGLQKVAVLMDAGRGESRFFKKLKRKFRGCGYFIHQWSKTDIIDKISCQGCGSASCQICRSHRVAKSGYFNSNATLKISEAHNFDTEMKKIIGYFKNI